MTEGTPKKTVGPILERIIRDSGNEKLYDDLVKMKREDLASVLITLFEERTSQLKPADLIRQYESDRFTKPSKIDQRIFVEMDALIARISDTYIDFIELSPVAPLGANSVLTPINQKTIIATARNSEVMADTVTSLALEASKRRLADRSKSVYLSTSQREIRAQKYDNDSGFLPHFRAISLVSSEEAQANDEEKMGEIIEKHLTFYLNILQAAADQDLVQIKKTTVKLSSLRIFNALLKAQAIDKTELTRNTHNSNFDFFSTYGIELPKSISPGEDVDHELAMRYRITPILAYLSRVGNPVFARLQAKFPNVVFEYDLSRIAGMGYYEDLCFTITGENNSGNSFLLASAGSTKWTEKLMQDPGEKCFAGGMGTELLIGQFTNVDAE